MDAAVSRTAEQKAADENLTEAIERCARAYEVDGGVIGDYVVVAANQELRDDHVHHSYCILLRDNCVAGVMVIGLLEAAAYDTKVTRD